MENKAAVDRLDDVGDAQPEKPRADPGKVGSGSSVGESGSRKVQNCSRLTAAAFVTTRNLGGAEGIRTPDLLTASQARSQLRHSPKFFLSVWKRNMTTQGNPRQAKKPAALIHQPRPYRFRPGSVVVHPPCWTVNPSRRRVALLPHNSPGLTPIENLREMRGRLFALLLLTDRQLEPPPGSRASASDAIRRVAGPLLEGLRDDDLPERLAG